MSSDDQIICQNFVVVLNISRLALPSNMPQSLVARLGVLAHQIGHLHGWQPPLPPQGVGGHTGPGLKGHQVSQRAANIRGQGWSEAGLSATDVGLCTRGPEKAEVGAPYVWWMAGISAAIALRAAWPRP